MTAEMVYSDKFKSRLVSKMVGPRAVTASALAAAVGINQPTLSRWLREARKIPDMAKESQGPKNKVRPQRPQDWSPAERLRVVVESMGLADTELGAFLRKEGLHKAQLDEWSAAAHSGVSARKGTKKVTAEVKRIRELERELRRKEKALAEAAALLILKKKAQAIWGDEDDATEPRNGK